MKFYRCLSPPKSFAPHVQYKWCYEHKCSECITKWWIYTSCQDNRINSMYPEWNTNRHHQINHLFDYTSPDYDENGCPDLLDRVSEDDMAGFDDEEFEENDKFLFDISEVDSGFGTTASDGFDWGNLQTDDGHIFEEVGNPLLQCFLSVFNKGRAAEWLAARSQTKTDPVPSVMLEMEVELQLLLTSIFDRLSGSETGDVTTVFNLYATIQRDFANDMYPSNTFQCLLPTCYSDVSTLYLQNRCSLKNNILCSLVENVDRHAYVSLSELLTILLGMGYEMDIIRHWEDFQRITKTCPITGVAPRKRARKHYLVCNKKYNRKEKEKRV
jgi:hypothetical protein